MLSKGPALHSPVSAPALDFVLYALPSFDKGRRQASSSEACQVQQPNHCSFMMMELNGPSGKQQRPAGHRCH